MLTDIIYGSKHYNKILTGMGRSLENSSLNKIFRRKSIKKRIKIIY